LGWVVLAGKIEFEAIAAIVSLVVIAAALALFLGVGQTGLAGLPAAGQGSGTVQIGVMLPLTGDNALYGESFGTALELAREEINARGGILGKKVEFVVEDSKCDAKAGVDAINSLVRLKGMKIVIAAECSGPTLSAAPVAEENKVLYLAATASNPDIKNAGDYVFRTCPNDLQQGKDLAQIVFSEGFRKTAVLNMDNAYGEGISGVFAEEFAGLGGSIAIKQKFNQNDTDFRTQLVKTKESNPDSLFLVAYPKTYPAIIKQMRELGLEIQLFSSDTFKDQAVLDALGELAEGTIFSGYAESGTAKFGEFRQAYRERYGKEYGPFGDYAYDSLYVLKAGIEQAKSFDPEVLKKTLYSLDYNGVTGETKFDSYGEVSKPYGVFIVKNGAFVPFSS